MAVQSTISEMIGFRLANLDLWLDGRESGVPLVLPGCHAPFRVTGATREGLRLRVRDAPPCSTEGWQSVFYGIESWQLWRDGAGRAIFVTSRHSPPVRQIAVDAAFGRGEVVGEFGAGPEPGRAVYPLQDIDMVLYANWLAETGDLILHAAGIDDDGVGYAFVGPSGSGKSTLSSELARCASVTVLGEDQVIVRYQRGQFLLYGTPWHNNLARCSPGGVPLKKLFFLDRANCHGIEPCGPKAKIERLLPDALIPYYNRAGVARILDNLSRLAERVPFYRLGFKIGKDAIAMIRAA